MDDHPFTHVGVTKLEERPPSEAGTFDEILDCLTVSSGQVDTECPMPPLDLTILTPLEQEIFPILLRLWENACLVPFARRDPNLPMTAERAGQWRRRITEKARNKKVSHIPPSSGIHPLHRILDKLVFAQLFRPHVRGETAPPADARAMFDAMLRIRTVDVPHVYMGRGQGQTPRFANNKKSAKKSPKLAKKKKRVEETAESDTESTLTDSSVEAVVRGPSDAEGSTHCSTAEFGAASVPSTVPLSHGFSFVPRPLGLSVSPSSFFAVMQEHQEVLRFLMSLGAESAYDILESRRRRRHHRSKSWILLRRRRVQPP